MPNIGEPLPKNIYKFAYGQGDKILAPKRYWRHALDLSVSKARDNLVEDFNKTIKSMDTGE